MFDAWKSRIRHNGIQFKAYNFTNANTIIAWRGVQHDIVTTRSVWTRQ